MNDDRDVLLRDYALSAGADQDRALRAALDAACPDCAGDLARAEAELASFALDLPLVAPPDAQRARILDRIRVERASSRPSPPSPLLRGPNAASPGQATSARTSTASAPAFPRGLTVAAAALACTLLGLGAAVAVQSARVGDLSQRVAASDAAAHATAQLLDDASVRLQDASRLAERLHAAEARLGERDRELADLRAKADLLRAADLLVALSGTPEQPAANGRLLYAKGERRWLMSMSNLAEPTPGRCYEVWFITGSGDKIASATFLPDTAGRAEVLVDVPAGLAVAVAAITDEPLGGVAVPTGKVHLIGKL